MRKWYHNDQWIAGQAVKLLMDIYEAFGWTTRLIKPLVGRYAYFMLKKEEERLAAGWTYEPYHFCEKNLSARLLEKEETAKRKAEARKIYPIIGEPRPA